MRADQRTEVLILYVGYFVTLAFMLIPVVSWYALGALVLQVFYALIRYMSAEARTFRSHLFNYLLGVGVSLTTTMIILIQTQALGFEIVKFLSTSKFESATSLPYIGLMLVLESLFAIFWPIILITRGLFLIGSDRPVFAGFSDSHTSSKTRLFGNSRNSTNVQNVSDNLFLSAILPNGTVLKAMIDQRSLPKIIGRDKSDAQIVISDDSVSRRHAILEYQNGSIVIRDLGSTNGTKLNGRDVGFAPELIRQSDKLKVGSVEISVSTQ